MSAASDCNLVTEPGGQSLFSLFIDLDAGKRPDGHAIAMLPCWSDTTRLCGADLHGNQPPDGNRAVLPRAECLPGSHECPRRAALHRLRYRHSRSVLSTVRMSR